jgi:hypothetical protein
MILVSTLVAFAILFTCFGIYVNDYYRADTAAIDAYVPEVNIEERELKGGAVAYIPDECIAGVIFYPGGKVDPTAYVPLMRALAKEGILAVLVEMPFNLAVLKKSAANGIKDQLFWVDNWYMAGHSLGGSMAAAYAADNKDDYKGVILLGAYSSKNLSESGLKVASIYGSLDTVMSKENYANCKDNLPADFTEVVIDGGNHSGIGMYGLQHGDTEAAITSIAQIEQTARLIAEFVK